MSGPAAPDDPADHHDRIDLVFARGESLHVVDARIVGEHAPEAGLVVSPWPSDHRAVVAEVRFSPVLLRCRAMGVPTPYRRNP